VREALGIRVRGGEALTDWRQRPLSAKQLEYAADDVRHLLAMRDGLLHQASEMGTPTGTPRAAWIEDECRRLVEGVVEEGQEERWRRGSGSGSLSRRELAVLREVWRWREETARRANQPSRRVMRDDMLVEIAKRQPGSAAELLTLRGLDRAQGRGVAAAIVEAVQRGMQVPNSELPESLRRHDPPQIGVLTQLLAAVMHGIAAEAQVDATLLAPMEELREVVRWRLDRTGAKEEPFVFQGWRGEILREPLSDLLDGKRAIRVAKLKSPNPLSVD
jgi:ribonuclease D